MIKALNSLDIGTTFRFPSRYDAHKVIDKGIIDGTEGVAWVRYQNIEHLNGSITEVAGDDFLVEVI